MTIELKGDAPSHDDSSSPVCWDCKAARYWHRNRLISIPLTAKSPPVPAKATRRMPAMQAGDVDGDCLKAKPNLEVSPPAPKAAA